MRLPRLCDLAAVHTEAAQLRERPPRVETCAIDGLPLHNHRRCAGCGILAGSGHYCEELRDGFCAHCNSKIARGLRPWRWDSA